MSLKYDTLLRTFIREDYQKFSGGEPINQIFPADVFYTNKFVDITKFNALYNIYNMPLFKTSVGSYDYYGQDVYSIFTNTSKPFIRFFFTANTESFGDDTILKHDIYKIPYNDFINYTSQQKRSDANSTNDNITETITETISNGSGLETTTTKTINTTRSKSTEIFTPNNFPEKIEGYSEDERLNNIISLLQTPIITITASTSGISTSYYDLNLDEYLKNVGSYEVKLFEDYSQYFITTQTLFKRPQYTGYTDLYKLEDNNLTEIEYVDSVWESTEVRQHEITGGTFSGISVAGKFFTYFVLPDKPIWKYPYVEGVLQTYSPTFYWSDIENIENYLIQISYDYNNGEPFNNTVYSYNINNENSSINQIELLEGTMRTSETIRRTTVPLFAGKDFWYRVGSVKEMVNMFDVKQRVVAFSDTQSATTTSNSTSLFVGVGASSIYSEITSTLEHPSYLDYSTTGSIGGVISGSIVTGATLQLVFSNGDYISQQTDNSGNFLFEGLQPGKYTLNTVYRGYQNDSREIELNKDEDLSIKLKILWDNDTDTWGNMANENFYL